MKWPKLLIFFQQSKKLPPSRCPYAYCYKMVKNLEKHIETHETGKMKNECTVCGKFFICNALSGPAELGGQGGHVPPQILAKKGAKVYVKAK